MAKLLRTHPAAVLAGLATLLLATSGCNDDSTGPNVPNLPGGTTRFSEEITVTQLRDALIAGPSRVEIELVPGSLVAREIELQRPEELFDEEEIESKITMIDPAGSVTLELAGLQVGFTAGTRFRAEGAGDLTLAEFVQRVQDALSVGKLPPVEAKRDPASEPQDPDDATFIAEELKLDDEADEPEIELNVDEENLLDPGVDDCDAAALACLRVLGLTIEIREGVTELEAELDDAAGKQDFEGIVLAVDPVAGTVNLMGGAMIRIIEGTEIEFDDDDGDELASLDEVAQALTANMIVEAEGEGVVETSDPLTIVAIEIEFEIEDDADDVPGAIEFEAMVASVDPAARSFTLANGTEVTLAADAIIENDGDLLTLQAVESALAATQPVRADGDAVVVSMGPPLALEAFKVKFEVDD